MLFLLEVFILIRLIADSSSDIDLDLASQLQVDIIPFPITFGSEEYLDRQTLTVENFYNKLQTVTELPKTSQITPFQFIERFRPYVEAGDEVVMLLLSSELSGTYQSAQTAVNMLQTDRVHLVNTYNAALGHHLLLQIAIRMRDDGYTAKRMADELNALAKRVRLIACMKTMKYLQMGGRVSPAVAKIGGILGITPIITLQDGKVEVVGKVRGHKGALNWMQQQMDRVPADAQYPVVFSHSVNLEGRDAMVAALDSCLPDCDYIYCDLGSTIGTHIGPGAIGFAYIEKE